jgi:hypothetical protein
MIKDFQNTNTIRDNAILRAFLKAKGKRGIKAMLAEKYGISGERIAQILKKKLSTAQLLDK